MGVKEKEIQPCVVKAIFNRINNSVNTVKTTILGQFQTTLVSMHLFSEKNTPEIIGDFFKPKTNFYIEESKEKIFYGIFFIK